jgi:DNA-binding LacI/PurR family transcriptional regulator
MTIREVARRAGVSLQTVSNVLNGRHARTSPETRQRVLRSIQELGYHPHAYARGLRLQRSDTVGYFTVDPSPQFLADPGRATLLSGVADVLREHNYCLLVQALPPDAPVDSFRRLFQQRRIDGAVVEVPHRWVKPMIQVGCPCVVLEERMKSRENAYVRADNRQGAEQMVNYLLAQGHKRVDVFTLDRAWPNMKERLAGYQAALRAHRLPAPPTLTVASENVAAARDVILAALQRERGLTALFCINDLLALGALQAAKAMGRNVPGKLAIAGFGDFAFAQYVDPPLTTMVSPKYEMGRRAAEILLGYLREGRFAETEVVFPTSLIARGSA